MSNRGMLLSRMPRDFLTSIIAVWFLWQFTSNGSPACLAQERLDTLGPTISSLEAAKTELTECPPRWKRILNSCYGNIRLRYNKTAAVRECRELHENATLPFFNNNETFVAYKEFTTPYGRDTWLAGEVTNNQLSYQEVLLRTGERFVVNMFDMKIFENDNISYPRCLALLVKQTGVKVVDCSLKFYTICQLRLFENETASSQILTTKPSQLEPSSRESTTNEEITSPTSAVIQTEAAIRLTNSTFIMNELVSKLDLSFNISNLAATELELFDEEIRKIGIKIDSSELSKQAKLEALSATALTKLGGYAGQFADSELESMLNPRREFLIKCLFYSQECNLTRDFLSRSQPGYGVCFTYQNGIPSESKSINAVNKKGLYVVLNTRTDEYIMTTRSGGVKIMVHEHNNYPFIDNFGVFLPLGVDSVMQLDLTQLNRISVLGDRCLEKPVKNYNFYDETIYSHEGCVRSFEQAKTMETCGCYNPLIPVGLKGTSMAMCDPQKMCINTSSADVEIGKVCKKECRKSIFNIETSFSSTHGARQTTMHPFEKKLAILLHIYFKSPLIVVYSEKLAVSVEDIFNSFCQMMGLFLGVSAIEMASWIISAAQIIFEKIAPRKPNRKVDVGVTEQCRAYVIRQVWDA